jgi:hypothetical protein
MGFLNKAAAGAIVALGAYVVNKVVGDDAPAKQTPAKRATPTGTAAERAVTKAKRPAAKQRAGAKRAVAKARKVSRPARAAKR